MTAQFSETARCWLRSLKPFGSPSVSRLVLRLPTTSKNEPLAHRRTVVGLRPAVEEIWGKVGVDAVRTAMPGDFLASTAGMVPSDEWVPVSFVVAWNDAVWEGPAARDKRAYREYVKGTINHGFGRVRKFFLTLATPELLVEKATEMWRAEYTTGELTSKLDAPGRATFLLKQHPFATNPTSSEALAEAFRCVGAYTTKAPIKQTFSREGQALRIQLIWGSE